MDSRVTPFVMVLVLAGCHARPSFTPERLDEIHRDCQQRIDAGSFAPGRSKSVGFSARTPKGSPVIVYGASWCDACHVAARYLAQRGIPFVAKDVDEDAAAHAMLEATLDGAGLERKSTLPVIDVRGTVTLGFIPCVIDAAWAAP